MHLLGSVSLFLELLSLVFYPAGIFGGSCDEVILLFPVSVSSLDGPNVALTEVRMRFVTGSSSTHGMSFRLLLDIPGLYCETGESSHMLSVSSCVIS
jgi:hypothetical protein